MRSSVVILLATAFSGVADAFANIGCMNPGFMNNTYQGQPDLENVITSPVHPANSYVGCPTYCKALLQQMISDTPVGDIPGVILASAFRPLTGRAPGEGECYCVNSAEAFSAKAVEFGDGPTGDCFPEQFQYTYLNMDYDGNDRPNYRLITCVEKSPLSWSPGVPFQPDPRIDPPVDENGNPEGRWTVTLPINCLYLCGLDLRHVLLIPRPHIEHEEWECYCAKDMGDLIPATCGPVVGRIYSIDAVAPLPSGFARKRMLAARHQAEVELDTHRDCPRGYDACVIPGTGGRAYECLDTTTELEACGGCIDGYFDERVSNGTIGTDCTTIQGVALGGASCVNGRCQVTRCRKGYRLVHGYCVRSFT